MPNYDITYVKTMFACIEADDLKDAGERAKTYAKNLGPAVRILSIHDPNYVAPVVEPPSPPTSYEKMVSGMRKRIDKMLK